MKIDYWYQTVYFLIYFFFKETVFFTSDEQVLLLIFRIGSVLGTATEKLLKEALAKNESYVSRSSLLIACFHKVSVNKTL